MGAWWNHVYAATQYEVVYILYMFAIACMMKYEDV